MNKKAIISIIKNALAEDIGTGDVTTDIVIPRAAKIEAFIIAKERGVVAGISVAKEAFKTLDETIQFRGLIKEGSSVKKNTKIASVKGNARNILQAERTALNLLSHLSGIATLTRRFVEKIKSYRVKILDTRKTLPDLRILEKYAVRVGGGFNHRMGLYDMALLKENHIQIRTAAMASQASIGDLIKLVKNKIPKNLKIEVEVTNLSEFKEALLAKPDMVMLDNMVLTQVKKAVKFKSQYPKFRNIQLEVSGGVNIENVRQIAKTGVERISIGALTHSTKDLDVSLEITDSY